MDPGTRKASRPCLAHLQDACSLSSNPCHSSILGSLQRRGRSSGGCAGKWEGACSPKCELTHIPSLQEDLSMPMIEEEIDGLSGLLFPFYDADTHMLYLAGKVVG